MLHIIVQPTDEVITNGSASFAICDNRQEVYSWGEGWSYQLGTYSERNREPRRVWALSDLNTTIDMLILGQNTGFAITSDQTLYGWGYNSYNQLGNGGTFNQGVPKPIDNIPKVKLFIFNGMTGVVLGVDNCVYTWGKNYYGEAGTGDQSRVRYATKLSAVGNSIVKIFDGYNAMYAVDADGAVYVWGKNDKGQVGIGNTAGIVAPTITPELSDITAIEKMNDTVYAMDANGVVYGWGENDYGQIGDHTTENVLAPFIVANNQIKTASGTGDVNSVVPIVGSIDALEISITHPANISYSVDPNAEDGFYCPDIHIQNNSKVPVKVRIEAFEACFDGNLVFQDVLPDSMDWNGLNRQETKSYIALGLQYIDENQWLISQPEMVELLFAADIDDTFIGALAKGAEADLRLCGYHGYAFDRSFAAKHELIFVVSLL